MSCVTYGGRCGLAGLTRSLAMWCWAGGVRWSATASTSPSGISPRRRCSSSRRRRMSRAATQPVTRLRSTPLRGTRWPTMASQSAGRLPTPYRSSLTASSYGTGHSPISQHLLARLDEDRVPPSGPGRQPALPPRRWMGRARSPSPSPNRLRSRDHQQRIGRTLRLAHIQPAMAPHQQRCAGVLGRISRKSHVALPSSARGNALRRTSNRRRQRQGSLRPTARISRPRQPLGRPTASACTNQRLQVARLRR